MKRSISIVIATSVTAACNAQVLLDTFSDASHAPNWVLRDAQSSMTLTEQNGRLEFSTTTSASPAQLSAVSCESANWRLSLAADFKVKIDYRFAAASTAQSSDRRGIALAFVAPGFQPDANGLTPGIGASLGEFYDPSDNQVYRFVEVNVMGANYSIYNLYSFGTYPAGSSNLYSAYPPYDYAGTLSTQGALYVRYDVSDGLAYVSMIGYTDPYALVISLGADLLAAFPAGLDSVKVALVGYAESPHAASGSNAWMDNFRIDQGLVLTDVVAPTGVTASDGTFTDRVVVGWNAAAGATGYHVFRSGTAQPIAMVFGSLTYTDVTATAGSSYTYSVKTVGNAGVSAASAGNVGFRNLIAPGNLAATAGTSTTNVTLMWNGPVGAIGYKIFRSGTASAIATLGAVLLFTDNTAVPGTPYSYTVKAIGSAVGCLSLASTSSVGYRNLTAPTGVVAGDGLSTASVAVTWTALPNAAGYKILRSGTVAAIGTVGVVTTFTDMSAVAGTSYTYTVKALGAIGVSAVSLGDTGYRNLTAPTGVAASDGASTANVTVAWAALLNATGYKILRSGTAGPVGTVGAVSTFADMSAVAGTSYTYTVKAMGEVGVSAASLGDTGYRNLTAPTGVAASDGASNANVTITWTAALGATGYKIFRIGTTGPIGTVGSVLSFADITAAKGTAYNYTVKAIGAVGVSAGSFGDFGHRNRPAPTNVVATDNDLAKVRVTWSAMTGTPVATGYEVWRTVLEAPAEQIATIGPELLLFDDTTSTPGVAATYSVRATYSLIGASPAQIVTTLFRSDIGIRPLGFVGGESQAEAPAGSASGSDTSDSSGTANEDATPAPSSEGGAVEFEGAPFAPSERPDVGSTDVPDESSDMCANVALALVAQIQVLESQLSDGALSHDASRGRSWELLRQRVERMERLLIPIKASESVDNTTHANGFDDLAVCAMARGDVNCDGCINKIDLALFVDAWTVGDSVIADLNRDDAISVHDLALLLNAMEG